MAKLLIGAIALALVLVASLGPRPSDADHIAEQDNLAYQTTFAFTRPDMFGPGGLVPLPRNTSLVDFAWNQSQSINTIAQFGGEISFAGFKIPVPTATFGAKRVVHTDGKVVVGAKIEGFDQAGLINVNYPVEFTLRVPKADSYRRGQNITIGSSARLLPGAALTTTPPNPGQRVG